MNLVGVRVVYRARPLSRFRVTGSNGQGKAKEGLAEVINIHNEVFRTSQATRTADWLARPSHPGKLATIALQCSESVQPVS